jgi:hypothetical protein
MKLTKAKLYKGFKTKEDALIKAIEDFQEYLDLTEDPDLSSMGSEFAENALDFLYDNDTMSFNDIRNFIENEFESA